MLAIANQRLAANTNDVAGWFIRASYDFVYAGDCSLSVTENATTFGNDCGAWFCRDNATERLDVLATALLIK